MVKSEGKKDEKETIKLSGDLSDFITETTRKAELKVDGLTFEYNLPTTNEELDWVKKYMTGVDDEGKPIIDFKKMRKEKLKNLVLVPWDKEVLQKFTGKDAEWKNLNVEERWKVFGVLRPTLFNKIVEAMESVENAFETKKKG